MSTTLVIELDWTSSLEGLGASLFEETKDFESITFRIVALAGPSSWPLVRFEGNEFDMFALVHAYTGGDHEMALSLLEA